MSCPWSGFEDFIWGRFVNQSFEVDGLLRWQGTQPLGDMPTGEPKPNFKHKL